MGKQEREKSNRFETTWVPQTPIIKPVSPIYPDQNQTDERRFVGLDHLSFGDSLALANTKSPVFFSGQTGLDKELIIKTLKKPKSEKHRPKVAPEAKPKRDLKPKTLKKPVVDRLLGGEEIKTHNVRKIKEVNEYQGYTPVKESAAGEASTHAKNKKACRRSLVFEDESFKPEDGEIQHRDDIHLEKQDQNLQDCDITRRKRKLRQSFQSNARLDKIDTPTKKTTTGHTRFRDLSSIYKATQDSEQLQAGWYSGQQNNFTSHCQ